ncbi:MAG: hypothetical protein NTAFB05_13670 [Nitrobacter sp.]
MFRQGIELQRGPHDPYKVRDIKIRLALALGRSKFAACPLDLKPRSLIGGDSESVEVAIGLRAELLRAVAIIKPLQGIPSRLRSASNKDTERKTDETSHK